MRYTHPFKAIINNDSVILILGTFPSIKSFENNFYYSHPKNQFWSILSTIFNEILITEKERINFLKKYKIALWDIVESCNRENSSDSNLKEVKVHDLSKLIKTYKNIKVIAFTSKKALYFYEKYHEKINIPVVYLPSPSPAYAAMKIEDKIEAYRDILGEK